MDDLVHYNNVVFSTVSPRYRSSDVDLTSGKGEHR
jgi:hypothetical protein